MNFEGNMRIRQVLMITAWLLSNSSTFWQQENG